MPDKKISELVNLTSLATNDEFVVVDKGANATKRLTYDTLATEIRTEAEALTGTTGTFTGDVTADNLKVSDGGTIGSATDPDAMSIASGGVVTFSQGIALAAGKGIDFSAYGAGVDSNLLDDYEEGTWTPLIKGASNGLTTGSYLDQVGHYTRIGRFVHVEGLLGWSSHNGTGNMQLTGFPFSLHVGANGRTNAVFVAENMANTGSTLHGMAMNSADMGLFVFNSANVFNFVSIDTNVSYFPFSFTYQVF